LQAPECSFQHVGALRQVAKFRNPNVFCALVSARATAKPISGYSFFGERARLIKEHNHVYIFHQLLLVNTSISHMPSTAFSHRLARLSEKLPATTEPENQSTENNNQNHFFIDTNGSAFHHSSFFKIQRANCIFQPTPSLYQSTGTTALRHNKSDPQDYYIIIATANRPVNTKTAPPAAVTAIGAMQINTF